MSGRYTYLACHAQPPFPCALLLTRATTRNPPKPILSGLPTAPPWGGRRRTGSPATPRKLQSASSDVPALQREHLLRAALPAIPMRALRLRIGLAHILPRLRLAVIGRSVAVIHLAFRIHPHHSRPAARSRRLGRSRSRRSTLRRTRLPCRSWSGSRHRRRSLPRRSRSRSRHRSCRRSRTRRPRSPHRSRVPRLHPLMPLARAALARRRRVRPILANPIRSRRSSRRSLRPCHSAHHRNQTKPCKLLHPVLLSCLILRDTAHPSRAAQPCHPPKRTLHPARQLPSHR